MARYKIREATGPVTFPLSTVFVDKYMPGARGRPRTRDVENWDEIERDYMNKYLHARRNDPNDCYRLMQSRCYYKRILKNMNSDNPKFNMVSQKVSDLDTKIKEIQTSRVKYQKQNILKNQEV